MQTVVRLLSLPPIFCLALACAQSARAQTSTGAPGRYFPEQFGRPASDSGGGAGTPCDVYRVEIRDVEELGLNGSDIFSGTGADLTCLTKLVDNALKEPYDEMVEELQEDIDDGDYTGAIPTIDELRPNIKVRHEEDAFLGAYAGPIAEFLWDADNDLAEYCEDLFEADDDVFYMNANCEPAGANDGAMCSGLTLRYVNSPISLLWPEGAVPPPMTLVNFPLNPAKRGSFFTWRASAETPLLVYDPQHTGQIKDGTQLFGNFTFGGPHIASSDTALRARSTWRNGYEALASLDADGSGVIDGKELEPLALWFDANRNGISEPGEVRPAKKIGLTALYFKPDRTDPVTGDIYASLGYERNAAGRSAAGASVDWFSDDAPTKHDLVARQVVLRGGPPERKEADSGRQDADIKKAPPPWDSVNGVWEWTIDDDLDYGAYGPKGFLSFREQEGGALSGHSYIEVPLRSAGNKVKSVVRRQSLTGRRGKDADGKGILVFEVLEKGVVTKTEARLSDDGREIRGKSETQWTGQNSSGASRFSYSWKAVRHFPGAR